MRRFELVEGTSSKFWEVELDDGSVTVRYGRIGTNGQTQTKAFADAATAKKEHDKLVKDKTGKGYAEIAVSADAKLAAVSVKAAAPAAPATAAASATSATSATLAAAATTASTAASKGSAMTAAPGVSNASASAPSATKAPVPSTPASTSVEWPSGGFQWSDELRAELPTVRGIHVPQRADGRALLDKPLVLADDLYGYTAQSLAEIAQHMNRPSWTAWGKAASKKAITRARLEQPDREYWLELHAQALIGRADDAQRTIYGYGAAVPWVVNVCVALHGLPFAIEAALDLSRALEQLPNYRHGARASLFDSLRAAIAAADDPAHDAAIAVFEAQAGSTQFDRLMRAHLCPHRADWVLQALADNAPDENLLLGGCVMPAAEALAYLKPKAAHMYILRAPLLLQIHLHDEGAIDLMAHALSKRPDKRSLGDLLKLALRMHSPRMLVALCEHLDVNEVRPVLDTFAQRWPAAVLETAIEHALASRSRLAEGWAVRMALREPAVLDAVMPALDEAARTRFAALLAELQRKDADDDELPPVLRAPPWLGKARQGELPTLALEPASLPDTLQWPPGEQARHAAYKPSDYELRNVKPGQVVARVLQRMMISLPAQERLLDGHPLEPADVVEVRSFYGASLDLVLMLPDDLGVRVWNSYPVQHWRTWGDHSPQLFAVLSKWGANGIPGFARYLQARAEEGLRVAQVVHSPRIAPVALHALRNLKKAKAHAIDWLRAHAAMASSVAIPLAFGKDKAARDDAAHGLRWFVQNGFESTVRDAAATHGHEAVAALQALLDADPLLVLPSRMPKLPTFFVAASFRRPELRSSGAALPIAAMEHIGTMLAISRLDAPYAGLAIVRDACTPDSLAEFAWDIFEAWTAGGSPSKENWAFAALGLLGNDETARRLAPRIREWPGQAQHQRAVTGLDLLALIGSDVALMHLNGIASKVKFKALQDRAKEKIATVAEARGFTAAELADRLVPDLGLDEQGTLQLDFGPRQFFIGFDETLKPFVKDAQGARLKDLPKPLKSDDAALADAAVDRFKQMKKDAKAVASLQVVRLELAMIDRRRWSAADFALFFLEHPLMRHLAARLLWGVYGSDGAMQTAFRVAEDWTLADADDNATTLLADASIGIAHVLEVPKALLDAFGHVFADYEILQPFKQLGRETYALTDAERKASRITRYEHKVVATGSVMGLINRGWERGLAQDAGWVGGFTKRVGDALEVELELDPGTIVGDPSYEPKQKLPGITLRRAGTWDQDGLVNFEQLHPIVASEVLRDVELLAAYKEP